MPSSRLRHLRPRYELPLCERRPPLRLAFVPALVIFAARAFDIPLRRSALYFLGFFVAFPPLRAVLWCRPGMCDLLDSVISGGFSIRQPRETARRGMPVIWRRSSSNQASGHDVRRPGGPHVERSL